MIAFELARQKHPDPAGCFCLAPDRRMNPRLFQKGILG